MPRGATQRRGVQPFLWLHPQAGGNLLEGLWHGESKSIIREIVPPAGWKPQAKDYQKRLENLSVRHPIEQNVQGKAGFYESKNIVQPKMTLKAYRRYAEKESQKVAHLDTSEKERTVHEWQLSSGKPSPTRLHSMGPISLQVSWTPPQVRGTWTASTQSWSTPWQSGLRASLSPTVISDAGRLFLVGTRKILIWEP